MNNRNNNKKTDLFIFIKQKLHFLPKKLLARDNTVFSIRTVFLSLYFVAYVI